MIPLLRVTALLLPALALLFCDVARRHRHLAGLDREHLIGWAVSFAVSAVVWGSALYVASSRERILRQAAGGFFVAAYGLSLGVQAAFFNLYNVYLSLDSQIDSESILLSIFGTLPLGEPRVFGHLVIGVATALLMLRLARTVVRPRRIPAVVRPAFIVAGGVTLAKMPVSYRTHQSTAPDLIYFHGLATVVEHRVAPPYEHLVRAQPRRPLPVPPLTRRPGPPRNVLLLLQEAQRADVTCSAYDPDCELATRASNAAAPGRLPLLEVRSNASSTHLSVQVMWSGLPVTATREAMETAPYVFEYARAAGYALGYWTSQNVIFGNYRLAFQGIPFSRFVSGTDLDPKADWICGAPDALLADRVIAEIGDLREPWFAVVQYANIHRPRLYFDDAHAPFQPTDKVERARKDEAQTNFYRNVTYLSDLAVGRVLEHVRRAPFGARTAIVYTSDHGESYFEHGQDNDHSGSVYDEEIHVPAWIDAPEGLLTETERQSIAGKRDAYLTHLDFGPTLLDLLGVWDAPELAPFRRRMPGHPITRPGVSVEPVALSNVSWVWEYVLPNWGMMDGSLKVMAREPDASWRCYDVAEDPHEEEDLGLDDEDCMVLARQARAAFRMHPRELGRLGRRARPWGDEAAPGPP